MFVILSDKIYVFVVICELVVMCQVCFGCWEISDCVVYFWEGFVDLEVDQVFFDFDVLFEFYSVLFGLILVEIVGKLKFLIVLFGVLMSLLFYVLVIKKIEDGLVECYC